MQDMKSSLLTNLSTLSFLSIFDSISIKDPDKQIPNEYHRTVLTRV